MKKEKRDKTKRVLEQTKVYSFFRDRLGLHLKSFWIPWVLIGAMLIVSLCFDYETRMSSLYVLMGLFVIVLILCPMNIIHGLIGTRGDIKMFFFMFLLINLLFSGIYYLVFFRYAGITFDVSQPHVEFNIFEKCDKNVDYLIVEQGAEETIIFEQGKRKHVNRNGWSIITPFYNEKEMSKSQNIKMEYVPSNDMELSHYYHRIGPIWVLQNTLLTSLMQEPTEFYSFACTYNGNHEMADRNIRMSRSFHWFLVFHILISWIFLGVFISLIYQKFRNM